MFIKLKLNSLVGPVALVGGGIDIFAAALKELTLKTGKTSTMEYKLKNLEEQHQHACKGTLCNLVLPGADGLPLPCEVFVGGGQHTTPPFTRHRSVDVPGAGRATRRMAGCASMG